MYENLTDRNRIFITDDLQGKIKDTKVLIAGCGVGSSLADILVRTGFTKFVLMDGDRVEETNLNRQSFSAIHVGMNKAEATAAIIKAVNPATETDVHPRFLTDNDDIDSFTSSVDYVVNTVDFNNVVFLLEESARRQAKVTLSPFNIGWGSFVWVFTPDSVSLREILGNPDEASIFGKLVNWLYPHFPKYIENIIREHQEEYTEVVAGARPSPQLGSTVWLSSILMTAILVRLIEGKHVKTAPDIYCLDIYEHLDSSDSLDTR